MFFPANICLFKVNNRSARKSREICSKLTKRHGKNVIDAILLSLLLTLNLFDTFFSVCIIDFEQESVCWVSTKIIQKTIFTFQLEVATALV